MAPAQVVPGSTQVSGYWIVSQLLLLTSVTQSHFLNPVFFSSKLFSLLLHPVCCVILDLCSFLHDIFIEHNHYYFNIENRNHNIGILFLFVLDVSMWRWFLLSEEENHTDQRLVTCLLWLIRGTRPGARVTLMITLTEFLWSEHRVTLLLLRFMF